MFETEFKCVSLKSVIYFWTCSGGKNGTSLLNGTSLAPSSNSTAGDSGAHRAIGDVASFVRAVVAALLLSVVLLL